MSERWVQGPDQLSCEVGGEIVILNLADDTYYGLTEVGAFVWERLRDPHTLEELRDAVVAEFAVDAPTCEADLRVLLDDLRARRLVHPAP